MKNRNKLFFRQLCFLIVVLLSACTSENNTESEQELTQKNEDIIKISLKGTTSIFTVGDKLSLQIQLDSTKKISQLEYYLDNRLFQKSTQIFDSIIIKTDTLSVGQHYISCKAKRDSDYVDIDNIAFILLSDIVPIVGKYDIKRVLPHDTKAYTQGLQYEAGKMYEGTGIEGESVLKEINLKNGETIRDIGIMPDYFGEGITIFGNNIAQITWRSNVGFVYDKKTFTKLREFSYATEGWGLTFDGKNLIMSDGTENLYYLDTINFSVLKKVQVYDNQSPITRLNELEYVDGFVYANVYTTNYIVKINPKNGKVLCRWEFIDLLKESDKQPNTDVLNGIAYNKQTKRFYITGKYWPKMFEMVLR